MNIPKSETIVLSYVNDGNIDYVTTRNGSGKYTLYKCESGGYTKLKTSENPLSFEKVIYGGDRHEKV